jgi:hypothetical protein
MEQMMACLLAEMKTSQAKTDASLKEMKEFSAGQEHLKEEMLVKMETNQERMDPKLDAHHEWMIARMDSQLEKMEAAVDVFEERFNKMYSTDLEANQEKSEAVAEQQDAPKEEAAVETIEALEDQSWDWHLAIGCLQQLKWTQGNGVFQKKLATDHRWMTCCTGMARLKGCGHKGPTVQKR